MNELCKRIISINLEDKEYLEKCSKKDLIQYLEEKVIINNDFISSELLLLNPEVKSIDDLMDIESYHTNNVINTKIIENLLYNREIKFLKN